MEKRDGALLVTLMRHAGVAEYDFVPFEEGGQIGYVEGVLSEKGIEDFEKAAQDLVDIIDHKGERVLIWSSPRRRARLSADILIRVLTKNGVEVVATHLRSELSGLQTTLEESQLSTQMGWEKYLEAWRMRAPEEFPEGLETPAQFDARTTSWMADLCQIAVSRELDIDDKQLRIIIVAHSETFSEVMREYGIRGNAFKNGEAAHLTFEPNYCFCAVVRGQKRHFMFDVGTQKLRCLD